MDLISCCGLVGIVLCLYAIYIERQATKAKKNDEDYQPFCNINDRTSCTAVLTSDYAHMLGYMLNLDSDHVLNMSNSHYGLAYYTSIFIYNSSFGQVIPYRAFFLFAASTFSIIFSIILCYFMFAVINKSCLVCFIIHALNILLFVCSYFELNH